MTLQPPHFDDCEACGGLGDLDGLCDYCEPSCALEYSPVQASFIVTDGRVSEVTL